MAERFEPHTLHVCGVEMCTCSRRTRSSVRSEKGLQSTEHERSGELLVSEIKYLTERKMEVCKCSQHGGAVHSELPEGQERFRYDVLLIS